MRTLAIAAAISLLTLASPTGAAPSFDCTEAATYAERRVCADEGLQWVDRQLARLYALALKEAAGPDRAALVESQRRFLAERDTCEILYCVGALYHQRLQELATKVNVHDAFARFTAVEFDGGLAIVRFGYVGAVLLWTVGGNHHRCDFAEDNLTQTGKGVLKFRTTESGKACHLNIVPEGDDMSIETNCRSYCGARARMDGLYTRIPLK